MSQNLPELPPTDRTTVRRKRERGSYDRALVNSVLDEGMVCHVGFVADHGPVVLPMTYARVADIVYLHGAAGNDLLRHLAAGAPACLTVTLLDGLVLARSAFHHSMNYRSVALFGTATRVTDFDEVRLASAALLDHIAPGRSRDARPPTDAEARQTLVLRFPIAEGSAKVRTGGPIEDGEDLASAVWAGTLPLRITADAPVPDHPDSAAPPIPDYVASHPFAAAARGRIVTD